MSENIEIKTSSGNVFTQINSVSELRDVEPKDYAYEALKNLAKKYQCIEDNFNGFYLGDLTITRYEFAMGLNTCLEKITSLIMEEKLKKII